MCPFMLKYNLNLSTYFITHYFEADVIVFSVDCECTYDEGWNNFYKVNMLKF